MNMIRVKVIIYRYFGIFIAEKEESEYLKSEEFWDEFNRMVSDPENDIRPIDVQGILIGSWQAHHGFCRPISKFWIKRGRLWKVINWLIILFTVLQWDLASLYQKRLKKK